MSSTTPSDDKHLESTLVSNVRSSTISNPPQPTTASTPPSPVTILTTTQLATVRRAIGAPPQRFEDPSSRPSFLRTNPRIPPGLYARIISCRRRAQLTYYFTSTLYNVCLVLQILLGAALTALSSRNNAHHTAITILAAANTVNAGLVALLHNSGLPGRIRSDWNEYDKVEMFLVEVMDSGVVQKGETEADVIQGCFERFSKARATVERNKPSYYSGEVGSPVSGSGAAGANKATGTVAKDRRGLE